MEPAFLAANEEALLAAGYTRTRGTVEALVETEEKPGGMEGQEGEQKEENFHVQSSETNSKRRKISAY